MLAEYASTVPAMDAAILLRKMVKDRVPSNRSGKNLRYVEAGMKRPVETS